MDSVIKQCELYPLSIEDVYLVRPLQAVDDRGYHLKLFAERGMAEKEPLFRPVNILQIFIHKGTLRGIHYQRVKEQSKRLFCLHGVFTCGVVDLRKGSQRFGRTISVKLTRESGIFIPKGCAVGMLAEEDSCICYMSDEEDIPMYASGIRWDDPDLNIDWGVKDVQELIISERDLGLGRLRDLCL